VAKRRARRGPAAPATPPRAPAPQAAASMVASLPRSAEARKQLQAPGASNDLLRSCVQARPGRRVVCSRADLSADD
jgi:hypothetical protein